MTHSRPGNILSLPVIVPAIILLLLSVNIKQSSDGKNQNIGNKPILFDQLGYRTGDPKIAFVKTAAPDSFLISEAATGRIVFRGRYTSIEFDGATGDNLFKIDFTSLNKTGVYKILIPALAESSDEFSINENVYQACLKKLLQSYYYQRCGMEINNGTKWRHPECHQKPAKLFDDRSQEINTTGGWHDAGDYNKFVPTTAVSAALLLYSYELNPDFFNNVDLNIPESNDSFPDILNEAAWALKWLIKMQRKDGAVYHKVSIERWTAENLPHEEKDEQYVFGISSTSTAGFAAVTALGARLIGEFDRQFSAQLLKCAVNAWNFLIEYPEIFPPGGFKNPYGVEGGEYGDDDDKDERLWASVELFLLTGADNYLNYFLSNYQKVGGPNYTISWKNTANFAYYSFLKLHPLNYISVRNQIISNLTIYCNDLVRRNEVGGYGCLLKNEEYYWGSNSIVSGYAFDLLNLHHITDQRKYLVAAMDQLHYLLGRNTFNVCFITGVGTNPVRYPYHQFSMLKHSGDPVPGLLVAGPNSVSKLNDKIISEMPGKCYEDYEKNYYVNEVAINYTAPLVYVVSYFSQNSIIKVEEKFGSTIRDKE